MADARVPNAAKKTLLKLKHCARYKAAFYVTVINRGALNVFHQANDFLVYIWLCVDILIQVWFLS